VSFSNAQDYDCGSALKEKNKRHNRDRIIIVKKFKLIQVNANKLKQVASQKSRLLEQKLNILI